MTKMRLTEEELRSAHGPLCGVSMSDGPCSCLVHWVEGLQREVDDANLQNGTAREACAKIAEKEGCQGGTGCWTNEGHNDHSAICPVGIAQRIRKSNDSGMTPVGAFVLKGPSAPCVQCGWVHKPGKNTLCST